MSADSSSKTRLTLRRFSFPSFAAAPWLRGISVTSAVPERPAVQAKTTPPIMHDFRRAEIGGLRNADMLPHRPGPSQAARPLSPTTERAAALRQKIVPRTGINPPNATPSEQARSICPVMSS